MVKKWNAKSKVSEPVESESGTHFRFGFEPSVLRYVNFFKIVFYQAKRVFRVFEVTISESEPPVCQTRHVFKDAGH